MQTLQMVCAFFLTNFLTCLSYLLTLASEGRVWTNHLDNLLCRYHSRLHFEWLRWNCWLYHSSNSWRLDKTTHLDCGTTPLKFYRIIVLKIVFKTKVTSYTTFFFVFVGIYEPFWMISHDHNQLILKIKSFLFVNFYKLLNY